MRRTLKLFKVNGEKIFSQKEYGNVHDLIFKGIFIHRLKSSFPMIREATSRLKKFFYLIKKKYFSKTSKIFLSVFSHTLKLRI